MVFVLPDNVFSYEHSCHFPEESLYTSDLLSWYWTSNDDANYLILIGSTLDRSIFLNISMFHSSSFVQRFIQKLKILVWNKNCMTSTQGFQTTKRSQRIYRSLLYRGDFSPSLIFPRRSAGVWCTVLLKFLIHEKRTIFYACLIYIAPSGEIIWMLLHDLKPGILKTRLRHLNDRNHCVYIYGICRCFNGLADENLTSSLEKDVKAMSEARLPSTYIPTPNTCHWI